MLLLRRLRAGTALATTLVVLGTLTLFAHAACCCGGGGTSGPTSILGTFFTGRIERSFHWEQYDGFWNQDADLQKDPPDSDLREMYIGMGCALENLFLAVRAGEYSFHLCLTPDTFHQTHTAL